ncbi:hypothetical protein M5585_20770 [Serratia ureilytica]
MLFAPLTAWLLGNVNRKHILQLALVLFIAGNLACAWPPATCRSRSAECWPHWEQPVTRRRPPPPRWGWWRKTPRPGHFHRLWRHDVGYCARHSVRYLLAKLIGWREIFLFIALLGRLRCWACRWRCAPSRRRASIR